MSPGRYTLVIPTYNRPVDLAKQLRFLDRNPDYSVAHGWNFQFYLESALGLTSILYRSPLIDADNYVERLYRLLSNYEAITYGVHRTSRLRRALYHTQSMQSMLARELLDGALAVIAGKVARLPILYSGRSLGPSGAYENWHPIEFLAASPQGLFEEYARYKAKLFEFSVECGIREDDSRRTGKLLDLAHLRYMSHFLAPEVLDYVFEQSRRGRTKAEFLEGVWPILSKRAGIEGALHRSRLPRRLRSTLFPWLRDYHVRKIISPHSYTKLQARTASGRNRDVNVYEAFQTAGRRGYKAVGTRADRDNGRIRVTAPSAKREEITREPPSG